ncbi:MAG TPA: hypothetical protein VLR50_07975 [Desulfobacterales bacterium]|nr:hypothetical protein [Desulfobacterales bacterium]
MAATDQILTRVQKGVQVMKRHEKTWRKHAAAFCLAVVVLVAGGVLFGNLSHADGKVFREEWELPAFYPRGFDGYGRIDIIFADRMVISDSSKKLSSSVVYGTPSSSYASKSSFRVGDMVGYLIDHRREIVSLWLIK